MRLRNPGCMILHYEIEMKLNLRAHDAEGATWHYHPLESGLQDFRRPLTLSLSPSDGERVAFRPGEGNTCVTSAWWWWRPGVPTWIWWVRRCRGAQRRSSTA